MSGNTLEKLLSIVYGALEYDTCMVLVSNSDIYKDNYGSYDILTATGIEKFIITNNSFNFFEELKKFTLQNKDWIFGHLGYDLKNQIEKLYSGNDDHLYFPDAFFFIPENVTSYSKGITKILKGNDLMKIESDGSYQQKKNHNAASDNFPKSRLTKKEYIENVLQLKKHIHRGDIFEVNYCFEFYIENIEINPAEVFFTLNKISPMPFAGIYKNKEHYLLCFSPERYLKKTGRKIISQPMKGTIQKGMDADQNKELVIRLRENIKERSENIMIADLVRNDLSRVAKKGSVNVEELCEVYSFKQVNQMISTISAILDKNHHPVDAIRNSFPMGSMTGAPKVRAMELIEKYEKTRRGIYSGSIGYFDPNCNFDLNVVIRSICYNKKNKYLSFMVGSAITSLSDPEKEYEECKLKAKALFDWILNNN